MCSVADQFVLRARFVNYLALGGVAIIKKKKGLDTGRGTSATAPRALLIINYVYIIFFLLPALETKLKRGHCFSNPPGMKAFTTLQHGARPSHRLGSEWNHNRRGMHSALSAIMWLVALNIVRGEKKFNFVPSDWIFNVWKCEMLIGGGEQVFCVGMGRYKRVQTRARKDGGARDTGQMDGRHGSCVKAPEGSRVLVFSGRKQPGAFVLLMFHRDTI